MKKTMQATLVVVFGAATPAWAQNDDFSGGGVAGGLQGPKNHVAINLSFGQISGVEDDYVLAYPQLSGFYALNDSLALQLDWGFGYASGGDQSAFRVGNPYLGGWYKLMSGQSHLRVGAGIALPLLQISDDNFESAIETAVVSLGGLGTMGLWDPWLWLPETFSLVVPARFETLLGDSFKLGADGALAILVPSGDGDSEVMLQLAGEGAFKFGELQAGARLQFVSLVTSDDDDTQISLVPFVRYDFGSGFVQGRFMFNLDEPLGPAFDDGGIWSLGAGVGFYL